MHETTNRKRLRIGGAEGIMLVVSDVDTPASAAMPTADAAPELRDQP